MCKTSLPLPSVVPSRQYPSTVRRRSGARRARPSRSSSSPTFTAPIADPPSQTSATIDKRYGRYVRFVQHDMPIDQIHPQARIVHEAVRCAVSSRSSGSIVTARSPCARDAGSAHADTAKDLELNLDAFDTCRTGHAVREAVLRDGAVGSQLAEFVPTPTFFINAPPDRGRAADSKSSSRSSRASSGRRHYRELTSLRGPTVKSLANSLHVYKPDDLRLCCAERVRALSVSTGKELRPA